MAGQEPKLSLEMIEDGMRLKLADSDKELSVDLSLGEASKFILAFGQGVNAALYKKLGKVEDPGQTMNVIAPEANMMEVTTHGGKTYLNIRYSDFPAMRLEVPEDVLTKTGNALLQIASTPKDVRDQKLN
jgi:hypothetical protein